MVFIVAIAVFAALTAIPLIIIYNNKTFIRRVESSRSLDATVTSSYKVPNRKDFYCNTYEYYDKNGNIEQVALFETADKEIGKAYKMYLLKGKKAKP